MLLMLAAVALASTAATAPPDTTIAVRRGTTLAVSNWSGEIVVTTWDKNAVRIAAAGRGKREISIEHSGSALKLESRAKRRVPANVDYRLTVPAWMSLDLSGVMTDITIEGSKGEVKAETVQGDIALKGCTGEISVSSVQGEVRVDGARGRVDASSVNAGVHVLDAIGVVVAESVNGPLLLERVQADSVDASTVNGCVTYEGSIRDRGSYHFTTHNGSIDIAVPERANATVQVATFNGGIDSSFPVTLNKLRSKRYTITLGSGSAQMELESFQGTIFLRRPGEPRAQSEDDSGNCGSPDEDDPESDDQDPDEGD